MSSTRHLGLQISYNLDWREQVDIVCLKASRKLSVLRRVKNLQRSTLDLLYKTTIRSVIDYGLVVYYHSLTQIDKNKIDKIQYSAAKLVSSTLHFTSRVKLEQEMGWSSILNRADYLGLTLFHKIHCNILRPLIKSCMPKYSTRNTDQLKVTTYSQFPFKGVFFSNSFFPYITRKWNMLPFKLKNKPIEDFKIDLKVMLTPKRFKFYSKGNKYKCSLLTRIRVGRSFLNEHSFTLGFSPSMICDKCQATRESPIHFLTECDAYSESRLNMLNQIKHFIPNIFLLPKKRQFEILIYGYDPENDELLRYNTKIMIATQNFIYDTKRFKILPPLNQPAPVLSVAPFPDPPI